MFLETLRKLYPSRIHISGHIQQFYATFLRLTVLRDKNFRKFSVEYEIYCDMLCDSFKELISKDEYCKKVIV